MANKEVNITFKTKADIRAAKQAERALKGVNEALEKEDFKKAAEEADKFNNELKEMEGVSNDARRVLGDLSDSMRMATNGTHRADQANKELTKSQGQSSKSTKRSGLAMLEFSRAVEDAQYGIRGVVNNISPMVQQLGLGAGVAGVAGLAAVAVGILGPKLIELGKAFLEVESAASAALKSQLAMEKQARDLKKAEEEAAKAAKKRAKSFENIMRFRANLLRVELDLLNDRQDAITRQGEKERELINLSKELAIAQAQAQGKLTPELQAQIEAGSANAVTDSKRRQLQQSIGAQDQTFAQLDAKQAEITRDRTEQEAQLNEQITQQRERQKALTDSVNELDAALRQLITSDKIDFPSLKALGGTSDPAEIAKQLANPQVAKQAANEASPGAFSTITRGFLDISAGARAIEAASGTKFNPDSDQELVEQVARVAQQLQAAREKAKELADRTKEQESELEGIQSEAEAEIKSIQETRDKTREQKEQLTSELESLNQEASFTDAISSLKDITRNQEKAGADLAASLAAFEANAPADVLNRLGTQIGTLKDALADGIINADEFGQVNTALSQFKGEFSQLSLDQVNLIRGMQGDLATVGNILTQLQKTQQQQANTFQRIQANGNL